MAPALGAHGILAIQLALTWASFTPLLPLLTGPRRDDLEPPVPRLVAVCIPVAVTAATASAMRSPSACDIERRIGGAVSRGVSGLLVGAVAVHAVAVLLGAPFTTLVPETMTFSLLIAALTFLPLWVSNQHPARACFSFLRGVGPPMHELGSMMPAAGCVVGAWLGAIPLCLDWEQPWQAWPLPMCLGGLVGFSVGALLLLGAHIVAEVRRRLERNDDWPTSKRS